MSQAKVIQQLYDHQETYNEAFNNSIINRERHALRVSVDRFPGAEGDVQFGAQNFPYLRVALVDKVMEEEQ
jgi:hypothetical protein